VALAINEGSSYSESKAGMSENHLVKAEDVAPGQVVLISKLSGKYCRESDGSMTCDATSSQQAVRFKVTCLSHCEDKPELPMPSPTKAPTMSEVEKKANKAWSDKITASMASYNKPYKPPNYVCDFAETKTKLKAHLTKITCTVGKQCKQSLKGTEPMSRQNCGCKELTDYNEIIPTLVWKDGLDLPNSNDVCKEEAAEFDLPKVASPNPYEKPKSGKFCSWLGDPPATELETRTKGKGFIDPKGWPCSSILGKCQTTPQKCPVSDPERPFTAYQGACQCLSSVDYNEYKDTDMVPYTDWLHGLDDDRATGHHLVLYQAQIALNAAALAAVASYGPDMGMASARKVCVQAPGNIAVLPPMARSATSPFQLSSFQLTCPSFRRATWSEHRKRV